MRARVRERACVSAGPLGSFVSFFIYLFLNGAETCVSLQTTLSGTCVCVSVHVRVYCLARVGLYATT